LDLNLHAYLLEVEFELVTQNPGDCVFLPYSMLHFAGHITDDPNKLQVAVSYMWLPEIRFHEAASCSGYPPSLPLAVFDTVWYYSGFGAIPQGQYDPEVIRYVLMEDGWKPEKILGFLPENIRSGDIGMEYVLETIEKIGTIVRSNKSPPLELWLHLSTAADMNRLGCNRDLKYVARDLVEVNKMLTYLV